MVSPALLRLERVQSHVLAQVKTGLLAVIRGRSALLGDAGNSFQDWRGEPGG